MLARTRIFTLLVLILILPASCAYKPPEDPNARPGRGLNFFPEWYDNMLGEQCGELYQAELPIIRRSRVQRGVEDLGMHLVRSYYGPEQPPFDFEFFVVDLDIMNAFALPGGKIFVFRGLLQDIENEAELAGVLSHEIGHVVARHGTKNMSKAILYESLLLAGTAALSQKHKNLAAVTYIAGSIGISLRLLKYSRDYEREADWVAIHNVYRAGYTPEGMITLFEHFQDKEKSRGGRGMMFLSSHPSPEERQKNVARELPKLDMKRSWIRDQFGFSEMQAELRSMPPAPKELKGKSALSLTSLDALGELVTDARIKELEKERAESGKQTVRVYVPANEEWMETGIILNPGQRVELEVEPRAGAPSLTLQAGLWKDTQLVESYPVRQDEEIAFSQKGTWKLGLGSSASDSYSGWYVVTARIY